MSDLIDRQAAINAISCDITITGRQNAELVAATIGAFADRIKALPSAQPKIVRCKDCKWKQGSECVRFAEVRPFPDDFCSRAERRKQ